MCCEEMKQDEQGTIGRLADYFGVPLNKKQGMLISSRTTFSAMKDSGSKIAQGGAASGKAPEDANHQAAPILAGPVLGTGLRGRVPPGI